jgi:hypothetical protein
MDWTMADGEMAAGTTQSLILLVDQQTEAAS